MQDKIKRTLAGIAALAALALGGAAIAGAAGGGSDESSPAVAEADQGESEAAEAPEGAEAEDEQLLSGPEADRARRAAEQQVGGTAGDVERDNTGSESGEADDDGGAEQGYQSPANAAYEVEVTKGGNEIDVYLDSNFQVLDTQADDER